jgi:hypothetical protein
MAQIFPRNANTLAKASLVLGVVLVPVIAIGVLWFFARSSWAREVGPEHAPLQPVPYSHQLHVGALQMQCQYCHNRVEVSAYANVPATETCMSCHSVIQVNSPKLAPVRESWEKNVPIQWSEVHNLPDFVYFNHSIHVAKGVGCSTCHGNVAEMGETGVYKVEPLFMSWCLDCHREPEKHLRPAEEIYNPEWTPPANQLEVGRDLKQQYGIRTAYQLTNCYICHR